MNASFRTTASRETATFSSFIHFDHLAIFSCIVRIFWFNDSGVRQPSEILEEVTELYLACTASSPLYHAIDDLRPQIHYAED